MNNNKPTTILFPQYMDSYSCIGPACEDTCCKGWTVLIDKKTYNKYKKLPDKKLREKVEKAISRVRTDASLNKYAKIKYGANNRCALLTEEGLCTLQKELGESYLCDVCAVFPRQYNIVNGVLEKAITLACPEAVRKVLLNPEIMEFEERQEVLKERMIIYNNLDTHALANANRVARYFWELRIFTIQVLQDRGYSLEDRLIFLGLFCQKADEYIQEDKVHELPKLIATYTNRLKDGTLADVLEQIPAQYNLQIQLLKELADERFCAKIVNDTYMECFIEFLHGLDYSADAENQHIGERYKQALAKYYEPFMQEHPYIMENYLVNFVFLKMFPLNDTKGVFSAYITLVLHYALIKMLLAGIGAWHQGLTTELVVRLIYSFSITVDHNLLYLSRATEMLEEGSCNTMAHMAILIKN